MIDFIYHDCIIVFNTLCDSITVVIVSHERTFYLTVKSSETPLKEESK